MLSVVCSQCMISADVRWPELDDPDANSAQSVDLGHPTGTHSTPDALCLLSLDGSPALCVRLRQTSGESYTFRDAQFWNGLFVIGWGHAFYVVDVDSLTATRHDLSAYFSYIHAGDVLLIASAERVLRVGADGAVVWTSDPVAIDGITFSNVDSDFVDGDGEWDPPGGWKPFRLRLRDGTVVSGGQPDW